jgi:hypothetical protein
MIKMDPINIIIKLLESYAQNPSFVLESYAQNPSFVFVMIRIEGLGYFKIFRMIEVKV